MHQLALALACAVAFPTPQQHPETTPNRAQIGGVSLIIYLAERESYPGLRLARPPAGVELPHNSRQRIILHGRGPRQPLNLNRFLCSVSRSRSRGPALTCDPRVRRTSSSNPRAVIHLRLTRLEDIGHQQSSTFTRAGINLRPSCSADAHCLGGNSRLDDTRSAFTCGLATSRDKTRSAFTCGPVRHFGVPRDRH
jgi:hypothetical protein